MTVVATRGTSNSNQRGSSADRARRRAYLLATYAADVQVIEWTNQGPAQRYYPENPVAQARAVAWLEDKGREFRALATCRCYRCGALLVDDTVTVDRIVPGVKGGTYRRENIRPACAFHNSQTGGALASRKPKKGK